MGFLRVGYLKRLAALGAIGAAGMCIAFATMAGGAKAPADPELAALSDYTLGAGPAAAPLRLAQTDQPKIRIVPNGAPAEEPGEPPADEELDPVIYFDKTMTTGAVPINGNSIAKLIEGQPMFPPIEGLDERYWKQKHCPDCHQWNKERLCEQARTYVGEGLGQKMIFRLQHPYGAPFKVALMRWANGGCL
jgi:hypothetical protein